MRLKNKKTGEIGLVHCDATMLSNKIGVFIDNNHIDLRNPYKIYNSLAELSADWEDVPEEPKEYYLINLWGEVSVEDGKYQRPGLSELGLTFETEEEAELAVRKLKAWKRLKDKGFRFVRIAEQNEGHRVGQYIEFEMAYHFTPDAKQIGDDLDLLFCTGEDD